MNFRSIIVLIVLLAGSNLQANVQPLWVHGDNSCPEPNKTERYIQVPLFHDLEKVARVDRIPGLNTHDELQERYDGAKINLFYELLNGWSPNKELLIFIPGGPGQPHADLHHTMEMYKKETPELLEKFNIIAMDHRGLGCSKPMFPGSEPYQSLYMRQAASDIDLIRSELVGNGKINVWGYSYGSILSQTYALLYPDNVDRLLLGGAVSSAEDFHLAGTLYTSNVFSAVSPRTTEKFMNLTENRLDLREKVLDWAFGPLYSYLGRTQDIPNKIDEVIESIENGNLKELNESLSHDRKWVMAWMMKSIACGELFPNYTKYDGEYFLWKQLYGCKDFEGISEYFDYSDLLHQIEAPTLIFGGAFDHVTPAASMIKMAQKIPNSYIFIDPYMGHGLKGKYSCFLKLNEVFFLKSSFDSIETLVRDPVCSGLPSLAPEKDETNIDKSQTSFYF